MLIENNAKISKSLPSLNAAVWDKRRPTIFLEGQIDVQNAKKIMAIACKLRVAQWFWMCQFENSEKGSPKVLEIQNFNKINCFYEYLDIWPKLWAFFAFFGFFYL